MMVIVFLKYTMDRDAVKSLFNDEGTYALSIASGVGKLLDTNKTAIYNAYQEWEKGDHVVENYEGPRRPGTFRHPTQGTYARRFLLDREDLKLQFKKWMRKNLRMSSLNIVWGYLNLELLNGVNNEVLASFTISVPVSQGTASLWMKKWNATQMGAGKTYYIQ